MDTLGVKAFASMRWYTSERGRDAIKGDSSCSLKTDASFLFFFFFFYQIQYSETLFSLLLHRAPTQPGFHAEAGRDVSSLYRTSPLCCTEIRINLIMKNKVERKMASRWMRPMSIDLQLGTRFTYLVSRIVKVAISVS